MEDLSLKYLEPREYDHIVRKLSESDAARQAFIATFVRPIEDRLRALGIRYKLKSRTKSIYSIWRKMRKQRVPFEEVYDLFAIRIIIDCPPDQEKMQCWSVYSVVTDFYTPNPDRMRDWISIPKSNGYESLHTTVVTPQGRWVEVQIRTRRMDEVAERGVAAHWRYKGVGGGGLGSEQWLARLREIVETTAAAETIEERFDLALSSNEVFVFTPTGDLRKLREGSTVLDFAFDIHSNLGMTCTGGRINGRNVSLRERHLQDPASPRRLARHRRDLESQSENQTDPARRPGPERPARKRGAGAESEELETPPDHRRGRDRPVEIL